MGMAAEQEFDPGNLPGYWREADARYALDGWSASGLTLPAFAELHDLKVERLRRWLRRLEVPAETDPVPRFVRLVVVEPRESPPLLVHVGGVVVEVPNDFDPDALLRLVRALSC